MYILIFDIFNVTFLGVVGILSSNAANLIEYIKLDMYAYMFRPLGTIFRGMPIKAN
jgi:hypothetical protein